jgi:hypothetical protein
MRAEISAAARMPARAAPQRVRGTAARRGVAGVSGTSVGSVIGRATSGATGFGGVAPSAAAGSS